nr:MAG TPA: hypothetical protein [Caudoviricetes sp.]
MAKDMKHAKYMKWILGDKDALEQIKLRYEDLKPVLTEHKVITPGIGLVSDGNYVLIFKVEMSVWNEIVKRFNLKCDKSMKGKKAWRIA